MHENSFTSDAFLQSYMESVMPADLVNSLGVDLEKFGERVATEVWDLGQECEINQPYLVNTDAWGKRVDKIVTCPAWKRQKEISAEEGLIAIAYERNQKEFSRLYQIIKLYLYSPASGMFSCPLAMTDGAAKVIESLELGKVTGEAFSHLVSRDPRHFWTSGQWMTEKAGGSDVGSGTETLAYKQEDGTYRLNGYKWFSSATDSDICLTLGRIVYNEGGWVKGTKGLSMFYVQTRKKCGELNNIEVVKMKNKLGTRQLPTAELLLDGTEAKLISEPGRGVAGIIEMLNITSMIPNSVLIISLAMVPKLEPTR